MTCRERRPLSNNMNSLPDIAREIRKNTIRMLVAAQSGHTAGPLGTADFFAQLYFGGLINFDPKKPQWEERDRVILSCGHYCPVFYTTLAMAGYFPVEELITFRKLGSPLQGHVVHQVPFSGTPHRQLPGVENTGGPLGQGMSLSVGMAIAARMDKRKWKVVCISSDGEQEEGQTWEAYMAAAKYHLGNLTFFIDRNEIQISGNIAEIMPLEPFRLKLEAFGLKVKEIDGHNFEEIKKAYEWGQLFPDQPKAIIMRTTPGKGVSFMENKYEWHGKAPTEEEGKRALMELEK
ncbi:MAG: Transketolase, thiamine pyrophosphate-binding domain protein [Candidatus Collierbacteria bacterium GW2011_GWB1_44_6]|uniref:Transketolase, thiamine pyrophosphate-binding domain protein n=2 Tax=Candidatus Collieribacteriota TaxID=1752725 RepID=A0A0G1LX87_9BACT|nr:MAG: Transketolase, thiamine pyrophosphate-binding domain protein [Candidatus Collierbacteria bacterium GW2011_GWC2_43_12]KKT73437.1 MAG: Transketolase, thiamine pyrophosphate-binding domain protein [Candidatus Collierbacteria bacterium GW2011_GWB1_44_6]KKT82938.1 MAG: transketolase [Microgenomates group bacterium GW2011_GWC1_44_9]